MSEVTGAVNPLSEAIALARRPFTAAAVKWKVQVNPRSERAPATVVAYIDARLAGERLNHVGLLWSSEFTPVAGGMLCTISAEMPTPQGPLRIKRSDVGWSSGTGDNMPLKTLYSDAFKRAAVHFGVGVSLYALPMMKLWANADEITLREKTVRGEKVFQATITEKGQQKLNAEYERWLKDVGEAQFGEAISHGDVLGAAGDVDSTDAVSSGAAEEPEAKAPAPEPKSKPEPKAAPAADAPISKEGAAAVASAFTAGKRTLDEVENFLVAKGVEPETWEKMKAGTLDDAWTHLSKGVGKQLYDWLRKDAA